MVAALDRRQTVLISEAVSLSLKVGKNVMLNYCTVRSCVRILLGVGLLLASVSGVPLCVGHAEEGVGNGVQQQDDSPVATPPRVIRSWPSIEAFLGSEREQPVWQLSELKVRTDIKQAIELSVKSLAEHTNRDRARRPPLQDPANRDTSVLAPGKSPELYWGADCLADGTGRFGPTHRRHALDTGVAHVVGRAMWALLLAEETVGVRPTGETMEILTRYCRDMYDNPDHLGALIDPDRDFRRFIVCHDIREGFLGLLSHGPCTRGRLGRAGSTTCFEHARENHG